MGFKPKHVPHNLEEVHTLSVLSSIRLPERVKKTSKLGKAVKSGENQRVQKRKHVVADGRRLNGSITRKLVKALKPTSQEVAQMEADFAWLRSSEYSSIRWRDGECSHCG